MRATALATDAATKSTAALTLSSAYFLADNPHAANTVLMEQQAPLKTSAFRGAAALLTGMVQLTVAGESPEDVSGRAVVTALNQVVPEDFFGDSGYLLIGRAMSSIGLMEQAVMLYERALQDDLPSWIAEKMREFVVDYRMLVGEYGRGSSLGLDGKFQRRNRSPSPNPDGEAGKEEG